MIVFRCSLKKWAGDLTGTGSFLYGGRWNSVGTRIVYTAENNVLAAFEIALRIPLDQISKSYMMTPITIPDDAETFHPRLAKSWYLDPNVSKNIGDQFVKEGKYLVMKVPSALISDSWNFLINPAHPRMKEVRAGEPRTILFDKRLADMIRENK